MNDLLFHMAQLGCLNPVYPGPKEDPDPSPYTLPLISHRLLVRD